MYLSDFLRDHQLSREINYPMINCRGDEAKRNPPSVIGCRARFASPALYSGNKLFWKTSAIFLERFVQIL